VCGHAWSSYAPCRPPCHREAVDEGDEMMPGLNGRRFDIESSASTQLVRAEADSWRWSLKSRDSRWCWNARLVVAPAHSNNPALLHRQVWDDVVASKQGVELAQCMYRSCRFVQRRRTQVVWPASAACDESTNHNTRGSRPGRATICLTVYRMAYIDASLSTSTGVGYMILRSTVVMASNDFI